VPEVGPARGDMRGDSLSGERVSQLHGLNRHALPVRQ
jgi:hypothetical protein